MIREIFKKNLAPNLTSINLSGSSWEGGEYFKTSLLNNSNIKSLDLSGTYAHLNTLCEVADIIKTTTHLTYLNIASLNKFIKRAFSENYYSSKFKLPEETAHPLSNGGIEFFNGLSLNKSIKILNVSYWKMPSVNWIPFADLIQSSMYIQKLYFRGNNIDIVCLKKILSSKSLITLDISQCNLEKFIHNNQNISNSKESHSISSNHSNIQTIVLYGVMQRLEANQLQDVSLDILQLQLIDFTRITKLCLYMHTNRGVETKNIIQQMTNLTKLSLKFWSDKDLNLVLPVINNLKCLQLVDYYLNLTKEFEHLFDELLVRNTSLTSLSLSKLTMDSFPSMFDSLSTTTKTTPSVPKTYNNLIQLNYVNYVGTNFSSIKRILDRNLTIRDSKCACPELLFNHSYYLLSNNSRFYNFIVMNLGMPNASALSLTLSCAFDYPNGEYYKNLFTLYLSLKEEVPNNIIKIWIPLDIIVTIFKYYGLSLPIMRSKN
eukprot:TRINITY_DN5120_c0_g2_i1.p1 TRINITY_DN5120_c0_g2~~TRINITY_DN5120_c0_g2_i1.p1  ORF type:complete len:488 (-),score=54.35 TRINITY_DN5120_c0_g2_i1:410-1873(-)